MAKSLWNLLIKVHHVIVANFYVANMAFNTIRKNKILAKNSEFTVKQTINHLTNYFLLFVLEVLSGVFLLNSLT